METEYIFDSKVKNDKIDVHNPKVSLEKLPFDRDNFVVKLKGIDNSIVNSLRRTILQYIPIYGFNRSNIVIDSHRSHHMYTNDMIYNQIESLPIYDISNDFDLEDPHIYLSTKVMLSLFGHYSQQKISATTDTEKAVADNKKLFNIEIVISYKNTTSKNHFLSTHDITLRVNGKVNKSYLARDPIAILVLKPGEELYLNAKANLGTAIMHAAYEATTNAYHIKDRKDPSIYTLKYSSLGQIDEQTIFKKACTILIKKLELFRDYVKDNHTTDKNQVEINIYGENHTMGHLIATALQKYKYVEKAGYSMPHPFMDSVKILYVVGDTDKKPLRILTNCVDYLITVYQMLRDQI